VRVTEIQRWAGADWAFIKDSSALAIVEGDDTQLSLICLHEWRGDKTQRDPRVVVPGAAALLKKHKCESAMTDRYYEAYVEAELEDEGIGWLPAPITTEEIAASFMKLRMLLNFGQLKLNGHPRVLPLLERLKQQLKKVRSKAQAGGVEKIILSSSDGSHSDLVSALVLAVWQAPTVAQGGTILRLKSRTAGHDHRFAESDGKFYENSQDFEEADDAGEPMHEPLIAIG